MRPDDWYCNDDWGPEARELFWRKFAAARDSKHWAAVEKSGRLWCAGLKQEARALLVQAEAMAPGEVDAVEQRVRFAFDEGDLQTAENYYRAQDDRDSLARVLARYRDPSKRRESRALLAEWYRGDAVSGLDDWEHCADRAGPVAAGESFSHQAYALVMIHFQQRPKGTRLGAMDARMEDLLDRRDARAAQELDRYYRATEMPGLAFGIHQPNHPASRWPKDYLLRSYVPALGAYLGQMLVEHRGGAWRRAEPVQRSVVSVGGRDYDPFRHAFDVVFYYASCEEFVDAPSGRDG